MAPNVLFLNTDQQSRFACGRRTDWFDTPHLDALAASGVDFDRAYCAAPVCSPSRSCLHRGRPAHQTGVLVNGMAAVPGQAELCNLFHAAGYDVCWAGNRRGDQPPVPVAPEGRFDLPFPEGLSGLGRDTDGPVVDAAIDFLRRPRQRPFFLTVPLMNPHDICYWIMDRAPDTADAGADLPPLPESFADADGEPDFVRRCRQRPHYGQENTYARDWDEDRWRAYLREYAALTRRVDGEIGRLLAALDESGQRQETIVLHTADHGEGMAHHRWVVKLMGWESVVGVPLTISWPGRIDPGTRCDALCTGMDVLPTLCDAAGIEPPADLTGRCLLPVVDGTAAGADHAVIELHPDTQDLDLSARIVVTRRHKYMRFSWGDPREWLVDLAADPEERRDLAADDPSLLQRHRDLLGAWTRRTGDPWGLART